MNHESDPRTPPADDRVRRSQDLAIRCNTVVTPLLITLTIPVLVALMAFTRPAPPEHPWAERAAALGVEPMEISIGEATYRSTCALCHGDRAEGKARLGKPLRNSAYVQQHTDLELFVLISQGRMPSDPENTTGVDMPPKGGNPAITDEQIADIVKYIRNVHK